MLSWFGRLLAQTQQGAFRREIRRLTVPRGSTKQRLQTNLIEMFIFIHMGYWRSMRSRWLDNDKVLFCDFIDRNEIEVNKNDLPFERRSQIRSFQRHTHPKTPHIILSKFKWYHQSSKISNTHKMILAINSGNKRQINRKYRYTIRRCRHWYDGTDPDCVLAKQ